MGYGFFHQRDSRLVAAQAWFPDAGRPDGRRLGILAVLTRDIELLKQRGENTAIAQLQVCAPFNGARQTAGCSVQ